MCTTKHSFTAAIATTTTRNSRIVAFLISMAAAVFLAMRVYLAAVRFGTIAAGLHFLSNFFTILTNTCIMVAMGRTASGVTISAKIWLSLVSAILGVGLVFHVALKHLIHLPPGLPQISDQGVHTIIPISTVLWWMAFEKRILPFTAAFACITWPTTYCVYILLRTNLSEKPFYPYPFLNLPEIGTARFILNLTCLGLVFAGLGAALLVIQRCIVGDTSLKQKNK